MLGERYVCVMNSDVEAKIIEAKGPIVLVVFPNWAYARTMGDNLRQQFKDLVDHGSMERIYLKDGREIHLISGRTQQMRGRRVDDLILHPHVYDMDNIGDIIAACQPCVSEGGRWHGEWELPEDEDAEW